MLNLSVCRRNFGIKSSFNTIYRFISIEDIQDYRKSKKTALYIIENAETQKKLQLQMFPYLFRPDLSFLNELFSDLQTFKKNVSSRKLQINIEKMKSEYLQVKSLENEIKKLKMQKETITKRIAEVAKSSKLTSNQDKEIDDEVKNLINQSQDIKFKIDEVNMKFSELKKAFYPNFLHLPNKLHPNAPTENMLLYEHKNEKNSSSKIDFKFNSDWSFRIIKSDISSCYLCGDYARLEFVLNEYFSRKLKQCQNFEYIKSASLFKSALVEGCGTDFQDEAKLLSVIRWSTDVITNVDLLHFTGTSSLYSLILSFAHTRLYENNLPWIVYTNGKNYEPFRGQVSQYDILAVCSKSQKFNCSLDVQIKNMVTKNVGVDLQSLFQVVDCENTIVHFVQLVSLLLQDLNISFRVVSVAAHFLKSSECYKIAFEVFIPSENRFRTVSVKFCTKF
jgi:hypothetical protein